MSLCRCNAEHPLFRAPLLFIFSIIIVCSIIIILHDHFTRVLTLFFDYFLFLSSVGRFSFDFIFIFFQVKHNVKEIDSKQYKCFSPLSDNSDEFRSTLLQPLLLPRVSGTPGNAQARQHIVSKLRSTNMWNIDFDTFDAMTPVRKENRRKNSEKIVICFRMDKSSLLIL